MSEKASKRFEAISAQINPKVDDIDKVLDSLIGLQLVGCKKKTSVNYWIHAGRSIALLKKHGFRVELGRIHHI